MRNKTHFNRSGRRNKHHILPKSRRGIKTEDNLILLDENRHAAFHLLFSNRTLREAAAVLIRAAEMKERV
jgi:hypothetical protein